MKKIPDPGEINALMAVLSEGKYSEAVAQSKRLTTRYPSHSLGWMILGISLGQTGRKSDALVALKKAAALAPDDPGVKINLGKVLQDMGRLEDAEVNYRKALTIKPDIAEAHCNMGNILRKLGKYEEAEKSVLRALALKPDFAEAMSNLGSILYDLGRLEEAEKKYQRVLEMKPYHAETHNNLGTVYLAMNRLDDAENSFRKAISFDSKYADAYGNLGGVLNRKGLKEDALAAFRQLALLVPEKTEIQHVIAALSGISTDRAPDQYVKNLFDGYANKFDRHLQEVLQYDVPDKLVELVVKHSSGLPEKWNVLDCGCGTGLVGLRISPYSKKLVGVDLSTKMIEKARARKIYQRLENSDLHAMMLTEKESGFDVIVAADVFIYVGKIDDIVFEAKRLLAAGGIFAFSVEDIVESSADMADQTDSRGFQLNESCRYSHSAGYLNGLASAHGFKIIESVGAQIRKEHGQPLNGHLVLWQS